MSEYSVIIPCYHDEQKLNYLLNEIQSLPQKLLEVIVIDGAASDACKNICLVHNVKWYASEPCRGKQLLLGASLARGRILWFLHADTALPKNPFDAIQNALINGAVGGYFKFKFNTSRAWPARILEKAIAFRCKIGVPYGDQGLFMTKQAYLLAEGHAPWPLFEEVPLVKNIRKQGMFSALSTPIYVDIRRWQNDGWWRRTWENRKLALAFSFGIQPNELAKRYRSHITNFDYEKKEA